MTTTESRLLRAVLESPGDDTPRLAYADEIQATEPERAEFIRVQCELAVAGFGEVESDLLHRTDRIGDLARRQRKLWKLPIAGTWFGDTCFIAIGRSVFDRTGNQPGGKPSGLIRRGFVSIVRAPLAVLVGGECNECYSHPSWGDFTSPNPDCPACSGTGRVPGIGRELFGRQPVTRVEVTDWRPALADTGRGYVWAFPDPGRLGSPVRPVDYPHHLYNPGEYPTLDAARDALSAALVAHFREQCGLPPLGVQSE